MNIHYTSEGDLPVLNGNTQQVQSNSLPMIKKILDTLISQKDKYQNLPKNPSARDMMNYSLTVEQDSAKYVFNFSDLNIPNELRPMLDHFSEKSVIKQPGE